MVKTALADIDTMVLREIGRLGTKVSVIVPLPSQVYCDLWKVLRPQDRFPLNPAMQGRGNLCSGVDAPVYVIDGDIPEADEAGKIFLPFDVVNRQSREQIVDILTAFLAKHPWLHPPRQSSNSFFWLW